jgi:hypothetical protein
MKTIFTTCIALALGAIPAKAAIPAPVMKVMGAQFYSECTNPSPGYEAMVVAVCEAYVAGIADGLQADRKMCVGPRATAQRLLPVALVWIRNHSVNGGYPASLQIATGLRAEFPCSAAPQARKPSLNDQMEQFENIVKFMTATKTALALFGM